MDMFLVWRKVYLSWVLIIFTLDSFNEKGSKKKKKAWQECGLLALCKLADIPPPVGRAENGRERNGGAKLLPTVPHGEEEETIVLINWPEKRIHARRSPLLPFLLHVSDGRRIWNPQQLIKKEEQFALLHRHSDRAMRPAWSRNETHRLAAFQNSVPDFYSTMAPGGETLTENTVRVYTTRSCRTQEATRNMSSEFIQAMKSFSLESVFWLSLAGPWSKH